MARRPLSKAKKDKFIELLSEIGNVTRACKALGLTRSKLYQHKEKDKAFSEAWEKALILSADVLEGEAWRRAMGHDRPITFQGKQVLDKDGNPLFLKEYSETLLIFLLKGLKPQKYRENMAVQFPEGITVNVVKFADGNKPT